MNIDKEIKKVEGKLKKISDHIRTHGKVVYDWGNPSQKSSKSKKAYKVLRKFNKKLEMLHRGHP